MSNLKFQAFEHLKRVFGENAETVVEYIETQKDSLLNEEKAKNIFLTKQEAREIFPNKEDLAVAKADMIKWFIGFWVSIIVLIIGLYLKK